MNNLSARLTINLWLRRTGRAPISSTLSYIDFASELRKITAPKQAQPPFVDRVEAVAFVRRVAANVAPASAPAPVAAEGVSA